MRPIGGFFELETPPARPAFHPEAIAFRSGRACLTAALEALRPRVVHVPFYCCDAVLEPLERLGLECRFYAIDTALDPVDPTPPRPDEAYLYVNYFGLKADRCRRLAERFGEGLIVDDTQAYFQRRTPPAWSFNSVRKFFGVPDGGFLYGPRDVALPCPAATEPPWDHLTLRLVGRQAEAFQAFQRNETLVSCDSIAMSLASRRLVDAIDHEAVALRRRANYDFYASRLGDRNALRLPKPADAVPFCYPFLPAHRLDLEPLYRRGIFVPSLWKDCLARPGGSFAWERDLSARLMPLPVDHRYDANDLERVVDAVVERLEARQ